MLRVRIMRGVSGSGKSFFSSNILPKMFDTENFMIFSADHYFIDDTGNYDFDPKGLPEAHRSCREGFFNVFRHLPDDPDMLVIVDNTNTTPTEIAYYYDLATVFTQDVEILTVSPPVGMKWEDWLEQCFKQSQHNVPLKSVKDMGRRLKDTKVPWYWKEKVVTRDDGFFTLNGHRYDVEEKVA